VVKPRQERCDLTMTGLLETAMGIQVDGEIIKWVYTFHVLHGCSFETASR
jgi:hypothetical protein